MLQQQDAYRQYLYDTVLVKRTRLKVRNRETKMWGLVAKRDIQPGAFIGIFTGDYSNTTCPSRSHYAFDVGPSQPCIVPFADEDHITSNERDTHPMACMNEPSVGEFANCHMNIQDFTHGEIENVASIPNHEHAQFFRCMCCFACENIRSGDALTWYYGSAYEQIREMLGYVAGRHCRRVIADEPFVRPNSQAVLAALQRRVPHYAVWPIRNTQHIKSARFKKRSRQHTVDSEGDHSESFSSGSDLEEAYKPRLSTRRRGLG